MASDQAIVVRSAGGAVPEGAAPPVVVFAAAPVPPDVARDARDHLKETHRGRISDEGEGFLDPQETKLLRVFLKVRKLNRTLGDPLGLRGTFIDPDPDPEVTAAPVAPGPVPVPDVGMQGIVDP